MTLLSERRHARLGVRRCVDFKMNSRGARRFVLTPAARRHLDLVPMGAKPGRQLVHFSGGGDIESDVVQHATALTVARHWLVDRVDNKLMIAQRVRSEKN